MEHDIPDAVVGEFTQRVWELVLDISPGKVLTYGRIAETITPPSQIDAEAYRIFGPRWVGQAMSQCPEHVPWHRVINSQGKISVRAASDAHLRQRERLEAEGIVLGPKGKVDLSRYVWGADPGWKQGNLW